MMIKIVLFFWPFFTLLSHAYVVPEVGHLCPPGFSFDGANCFLGRPVGVTSFIHNNRYYHSGNQCQLGSTFDQANCHKGPIPWNHTGFIFQNGWYSSKLPHFIGKTKKCPAGFTFDEVNCYLGKPPGGREAAIKYNHFVFKRSFYQNCQNILAGSWGLLDPLWCAVKQVPSGYSAFVHENSWYTTTQAGPVETWLVKENRDVADHTALPVCQKFSSAANQWSLIWSDEFNEIPNNTRCYTSNDLLQCVYKEWWGFEPCRDRPNSWTTTATLQWSDAQLKKYVGLRNLNKCRWQVFDNYNMWENSNPDSLKLNNFIPDNITISGGTLKMKSTVNPGLNYNCGRATATNPSVTGEERTRVCPYSGASLQTGTGLPWTSGNSPSNIDPTKRYVGFATGYGRFEFKARINKLGHGAWPSLWMYVDGAAPTGQGAIELDALEFIGDLKGANYLNDQASYGLAHQTIHNWGDNGSGLPHDSLHTTIPLTLKEWYVFAVEWESHEVRYYINNCLRKIIKEGDPVKRENGTTAQFVIPKNQKVSIIIGNPVSSASWLPTWYRGAASSGVEPRADFIPTEFEVDYIRVYGPNL